METVSKEKRKKMKDTIIFDLDGTLSNPDHRLHLIRKDNPDFDTFYSECSKDLVNKWCLELINILSKNSIYKILIVSSRRKCELGKTLEWLRANDVPIEPRHVHLLRNKDNYTADTELKKRWVNKYGKDRILFAVDDREKVVNMWRKEGIICLQCYSWKEFK